MMQDSACRRNGSRRTLSECKRFCLLSICACSVHAPKARRFKSHPPQAASKKNKGHLFVSFVFWLREWDFSLPFRKYSRRASLGMLAPTARYFRDTLHANAYQPFALAHPRPSPKLVRFKSPHFLSKTKKEDSFFNESLVAGVGFFIALPKI